MSDKADKAIPDDDPIEADDSEDIEAEGGDDFTDTVILSDSDSDDDDDDEDGSTAEVNVERLMAELEKTDSQDAARRKEIRRRLEELAEEKSFEDTYAIDFD
ncbi:MAG: hypothetical protein O3A13_09690 [Proteobacteria bacterium]|nr:hypothetical protein [Pseudomonadota bacterium]MDA0993892.1 hypothetical protein [Pseudomonadota bacterium]